MPEWICFAPRLQSHSGVSRYTYDTFLYVSVEKTLRSLLSNELYVDAVLCSKSGPGALLLILWMAVITGLLIIPKTSIKLQLFYDGLGVTNPLSS